MFTEGAVFRTFYFNLNLAEKEMTKKRDEWEINGINQIYTQILSFY